MANPISAAAWRRKCCNQSIRSSVASFRRLCITSIRSSDEQVSARSARTQNTTEELTRLFDQSDQLQGQDVRKLDNSLPNAPFQRRGQFSFEDQTNPQNQSDQHSFFKYDNASHKPAETQPSYNRYQNARRLPPEVRTSSEAQPPPRTQQINSAPIRYRHSRRPPIDGEPSSEAQPPQTQQNNRPFIRYDDSRQPSQTASQRPSTRPSRLLPLGAIDARSLGASPRPNGLDRRFPTRDSTRSPGAASGKGRPGTTDAARQKPPKAPRRRDRTATPVQRHNIFDSPEEEDTDISEEQKEYKRQKEEARKPKAVTYVPAAVTLESLSGTGPVLPAMGLGAWGQEEAVADWVREMEARSKSAWRCGGIRVDLVDRLIIKKKNEMEDSKKNMQKGDAEAKAGSENPEQAEELLRKEFEARGIAEKIFKGEYVFEGKEENGVLGSLKRQAVRNGSYLPRDWESLAQKVVSLLPAEQVERGGKKAPV